MIWLEFMKANAASAQEAAWRRDGTIKTMRKDGSLAGLDSGCWSGGSTSPAAAVFENGLRWRESQLPVGFSLSRVPVLLR